MLPIDNRESDHSSWELWRTSLCRHGAGHALWDPRCRFAHQLSDLRAPDESRVSYATQWGQFTMDRFYGQRMSEEQMDRIRRYYVQTPACDRPLWAIGLSLLARDRETIKGFALPWDFGLVRDYDDLLDRRYRRECPFQCMRWLWYRLDCRRERLLTYRPPPHALGMITPREAIPCSQEEEADGQGRYSPRPAGASQSSMPDRLEAPMQPSASYASTESEETEPEEASAVSMVEADDPAARVPVTSLSAMQDHCGDAIESHASSPPSPEAPDMASMPLPSRWVGDVGLGDAAAGAAAIP